MTHYVKNCLQQKPLIMELPVWHFTFSFIFFHVQPQSWSRIVCLVFLLVSVVVSLGLVAWVFARSTIQQSCLVFLVGELSRISLSLVGRVFLYFSLAEFSRISLFLVFLVFLVAERRRSGTRSSKRGLTRSGTENLTLHTEWSSFKVVIIVSGHHTEWMPTATRTDEFPNGVPNDLWLLIFPLYWGYIWHSNVSSKKIAIWFS